MLAKSYENSDHMLGHVVQHMKTKDVLIIRKKVTKFIKCQVIPQSQDESEKKRGIIDIYMCGNLLHSIRSLKGKLLSLVIIITQEIRHLFLIFTRFQNLYEPTLLNKCILIIWFTQPVSLSHSPKMSQQSDINKTFELKPITNSYGVNMLGVILGEKGSSKKPKVFEYNKRDDK